MKQKPVRQFSTMVSRIKIEGRTIIGIFQERSNRFLALVKVEGDVLTSFLPNPGRMRELLKPGTEVVLRKVTNVKRKTDYDLVAVFHKGKMVSIDSRIPNKLVLEALKNRDIKEFFGYSVIRPEYRYENVRFDFLLANESERCLLEVKSCTLVKDGIAMFPDAPTERGRRHIMKLVKAKSEGYRACVLFIIQRTNVELFVPNEETDPEFGKVLRDAVFENVEVYAYSVKLINDEIVLGEKIKIRL